MRAALQGIDASLPITRMRPLDEVIGASLTQRRFNMTLLAVFAGIALVLALAGIYGTVSYAVAQRTQELGIRAALGATRADVLRLVLWDGLKPVVLGLALGLAGAFVLRRTLDRLVYGVTHLGSRDLRRAAGAAGGRGRRRQPDSGAARRASGSDDGVEGRLTDLRI